MTSSIVHRPSPAAPKRGTREGGSIVVKRAFCVCLAVIALAEAFAPQFLYHDHAHFPFEDWPAFGSIYGFFACAAIIVVSKLLGKLWLMRSENYYEP